MNVGWQLHSASDFLLCHLPDVDENGKRMRTEPLFYLASPNDVVLGKPRDWDDHVAWLLEQERFEEALSSALKWKDKLQWISVQQVGKKLLRDLIARGEYEKVS